MGLRIILIKSSFLFFLYFFDFVVYRICIQSASVTCLNFNYTLSLFFLNFNYMISFLTFLIFKIMDNILFWLQGVMVWHTLYFRGLYTFHVYKFFFFGFVFWVYYHKVYIL